MDYNEKELIINRSKWTDIMVDLETTSSDTSTGSIIQLSAVMFNLVTGEIGPVFNRCLAPITEWDPKTLQWWRSDKNRHQTLLSILHRVEEPSVVINDFIRWNRTYGAVKHFWSKPSHYDFPMLDKYFRYYGFKNPFIFWKARDMRSYIFALSFPNPLPDLTVVEKELAHDALVDTMSQVKQLIKCHQEYHQKQTEQKEDINV